MDRRGLRTPVTAQRADVNLGRRAHACQGTSSAVEHPRRNLEPPVRRCSSLAAAESIPTRPLDLLINVNTTPSPAVPAIENFSNFGPVGVATPRCTTRYDRTAQSATNHRYRSCWHQRHMARPDVTTLGNCQQGGPETGSSSKTAPLQSQLVESWGHVNSEIKVAATKLRFQDTSAGCCEGRSQNHASAHSRVRCGLWSRRWRNDGRGPCGPRRRS